MALPLTTGSNPETTTVTAGQWVQTHSSVNVGIVKNVNEGEQELYLTYLVTGTTAPDGFDSVPKWRVHTPSLKVSDGFTSRDIYVWAVDTDATIIVEA